ncbi:MAG: hypothetical protein V4482_05115 [Pseudomonadota bacterium]
MSLRHVKLFHGMLLSSMALIESASASVVPAYIKAATTLVIPHAITAKTPVPGTLPTPVYFSGNFPIISTANNSYLGPTTIAADETGSVPGTFYNMGSIGTAHQSFTITSMGALRGGGTIAGNLTNSGLLSPGNSDVTTFAPSEPILGPGQYMNIIGDYTPTSTSTTQLYFSPYHGDQIAVSGSIDFTHGQWTITPIWGNYSSSVPVTYTAITWGTPIDWGTTSHPTIVITTGSSLNVAPIYTSTSLSFSFTGLDTYTLKPNQVLDFSSLSSSTHAVITSAGTTVDIQTLQSTPMPVGSILSGAGTINVRGLDVTTFSADNSGLTGIINITASTADIASGSNLGTAVLNLISSGGTGVTLNVAAGGGLTNAVVGDSTSIINLITDTSAPITLGGSLSGTGTVNITGTGVVNSSSTSTSFSGPVNIGASTTNLATGANFGSGALSLTGSTVNFAGTTSINNAIAVGTGTTTLATATGTVTFSKAITQAANSTLTLSGAGASIINGLLYVPQGATVNLSGAGQTTINTSISSDSAFLNVTARTINLGAGVNLGSGALSLTGSTVNFTGTTNVNNAITVATGTTTLNSTGTTTFTKAIGGAGTLTFSGGGTTVLTTANPLTGAINVNSTRINLNSGIDLGSGALTLSNAILTFLGAGGDTVSLSNSSPITVKGTTSIIATAERLNLTQALVGTGSAQISGTGTTYFTGDNSGLTGPVSIASNVNIGSASSLGSGPLTLNSGANLTLGHTLSNSAIAINASSAFTINSGVTATLFGALSGAGSMSLATSTGSSSGIVNLQGYSPNYTGTINASNISLFVNGNSRAAINTNTDSNSSIVSGAATVLGGTGTMGAVTINDNTIIQPGDGTAGSIGTMNVASFTATSASTTPHYQVQINNRGQVSLIKVRNGGTATLSTNFTVDVLMAAGDYSVGLSNYTIIQSSNPVSGYANALTWDGSLYPNLSFNIAVVGNYLVLQSNVTGTTLTVTGNSTPGSTSSVITSGNTLATIPTIPYTSADSPTAAAIAFLTPNTPVDLTNTTIQNTSGTHELSAALNVSSGASTLSTSTGAATTVVNPITSALGTTLNLTGGGTTNFSADNSGLLGNIAVSGSAITISSNLGSGALSLTNSAVTIADGASLNNAVTTDAGTTIALQPSATGTPIVVNGSLSGQGAVSIASGGTAIFNAANTSLSGPIQLSSSTAQIGDGADLGTGALSLQSSGGGAAPTIVMGAVTLQNPISAGTAATFTSNSAATLSGAITGASPLTFNGSGSTNLTGTGVSPYAGTLTANSGKLSVNSNMPNASVSVGADAVLSGNGTMKDVVLNGGKLKPGNSIGTQYFNSLTASTGTVYDVELNSAGESNRIIVTGDTTLTGTFIINLLMDANTVANPSYPIGSMDFNILTTSGTLTVDMLDLRWNKKAGLTFDVGVLNQPGSIYDGKALVVKYTSDRLITVGSDETSVNTTTLGTTYDEEDTTLHPITIAPTDIVAADSGLILPTAPPVAEQVEITGIVFNNSTSINDPASTATADAFHFKGFSSNTAPISGGGNAVEAILTAISKNGPVSYEKNETRLWVSPYVNRSRTSRTNSDLGNQGWSGGSLMGIEKRDQKNIWSAGLLTGIMGSRSHTLGDPNTFSKTTGMLFGGFNTYKYTDHKDQGNFGHELLISRTFTSIDSQRYGLDYIDKKTPFYALASYKTTTDVVNAQFNYLFDIIKKSVTSRLNTGLTYIRSQSGKITERDAGRNGIITAPSSTKSMEFYNGIGLRKIWNHEKITIRTTFVYEYGYQMVSSGSTSTTTQSAAPTTFTTPAGPRQNKHYLQLSSSYLDRETGLKFIASYAGVLYKNVRNHTGLFKVEYRFK